MFRSFIYLDIDKLYTYKRQIEGSNLAQPTAVTQKQSAGFSVGFKGIGLNGTTETSVSGEYERDISFDYDRFELDLAGLEGNDYFDCVMNTEYDISTIPAMKIFRVCTGFEIPEKFDIVDLLNRFMPMLTEEIEVKTAGEQVALENFLGKASADIPIIIGYEDVVISGKLNAKYLFEEYSTLEDYADQDVFLLCKVIGYSKKDMVEIFDPLKDFIRLPRAMRREMERSGESIGLDLNP